MRPSTRSTAPVSTRTRRIASTPASSRSSRPRRLSTVCAVGVGRRVEGVGHEHGALALAQVVARGLAGGLGVAEDAEQVVAQLERLTEGEAVVGQGSERPVGRAADERADEQRVLDGVLRALEADHLAGRGDPGIEVEPVPAAGRLEQVEELAAHELRAHRVEELAAAGELVGGQAARRVQLVAPRQAQVAGEDRRALAEAVGVTRPATRLVQRGDGPVGGRHTPSGVAAVHHVVVEQRRALEELHARGEPHEGVGVGATGGAVAPVEEAGAQPLAAGQQAGHGRRRAGRSRHRSRRATAWPRRSARRSPAGPDGAARRGRWGSARGPPSSRGNRGQPTRRAGRPVNGPRAADALGLRCAAWHTARHPRWRGRSGSRGPSRR